MSPLGFNPVQFYAWKKQQLGSASRVFETSKAPNAREQRLDAENQRMKSVIPEITAENLGLRRSAVRSRQAA